MPTFRVEIQFRAVDAQAERLNAEMLGQETTPAATGEAVTEVDADTPEEAVLEAMRRVVDLRGSSG